MDYKKQKSSNVLTIVFDNQEEFQLPPDALLISDVLSHFTESYRDDPNNNQRVEINKKTGVTFENINMVFEFCIMYYQDPIAPITQKVDKKHTLKDFLVCKRPYKYMDLLDRDIFELREFLQAADWLGVAILVKLILISIKLNIQNKSRDEMIELLSDKFPIICTVPEVAKKYPMLLNKSE